MHDLLSPVMSSILVWILTATLAAGVAYLRKMVHGVTAMEVITKTLMRSDLVRRYKECRDTGNWMSDERKREWMDDYELYHSMRGANGYLDEMKDQVMAMPSAHKTYREGTD